MSDVKPVHRYSLNPLFWTAAAFAIGIVLASYRLLDFHIAVGIALTSSFLAILLSKFRHSGLLIIIAAVAVGSLVFYEEQLSITDDRIRTIYDTGQLTSADVITVFGRVSSGPEPAHQGAVIEVDVSQVKKRDAEINSSGRVRFFINADSEDALADLNALGLKSGSVIKAYTSLDRDERYHNPGVRSRRKMLDHQRIDATATIKSPLLIEKTADGAMSPLNAVYDLRRDVINDIRDRFNTSTAGILIASTLGDKYFLDSRDSDVFRSGGTFHILVISGLHITIIGLIVIFIVSRITRNRYARFISATAILWSYALAVGAEPPVVRAAVMFTVLLFSHVIYRNASMLNSLGLCGLILLAIRPSDLFNPSFQLTFLSVLAIVAVAVPLITQMREIGAWMPKSDTPFPPQCSQFFRRVCETLYWNEAAWTIEMNRQVWSAKLFKSPLFGWFGVDALRRAVTTVVEGIIVSASVQLFLLPLMAVYFHRIPLLGVLLNIWAGVMLAAESVIALLAILIGQISDLAALPFVRVAELINWLLVASQQFFITGFVPDVRVPVYSGYAAHIYFVYFIPLIFIAFAVLNWRPFERQLKIGKLKIFSMALSLILLAAFAAVIVTHPFSEAVPDGRLTVEFIDVGQGDAAFITFPNGEKMLIDGGGRPNMSGDNDIDDLQPDVPRIGEIVVSEFLWEKGISNIDHVVGTHADADHVQGLEDVLQNFNVGNLYVGNDDKQPSESDLLLHIADKRNVPITRLTAGQILNIDGVTINVLWPRVGENSALSDNDLSLVLLINYGERTFLFTGDIEKYAEAELVSSGQLLRVDVLKVAHHGSRTSSTTDFISLSKPEFAIISVGRRSLFGHPHTEVVKTLTESGAKIIRTGQNGTITISTDGKDLRHSTYIPEMP